MAVSGTSLPYLFMAATSKGGRTFGMRRARNPRHLTEQLRKERLVPLHHWALPAWAAGGAPGGRDVAGQSAVPLKDQAELHQQLGQLLSRGVPLVEALEVTMTSVHARTQGRVGRMRDMVASGAAFSDAAAAVHMFDRVTVAVYRAAERTGDLAGAAKQLSTTARRQLAIVGKVGTLLVYPAVVITVSLVVTVLVITAIVPRVGKALQAAGAELPWFTRALIVTGETIQNQWPLFLAALLGVIFAMVAGRRVIAGLVARVARRAPLLRDVVLAQESARFFTVMAAMTRSGIPLADALGVASGAIGHPALRAQLENLRTRLVEGGLLRTLIDSVTALPLPTRRLLIAAERSGDMESAFDTLAGDMADELDRRVARLMAVLEPLLILFMFFLIGSMLLALMIPLIRASAQAVG